MIKFPNRLIRTILFLTAFLVFCPAVFATVNYNLKIVADNDFALFAGTPTSVTRLLYQNNVSWGSQITAASTVTFTLDPSETKFYLLALGGGGAQENISGTLNDVDITTVAVLQSSDLASYLTGYAAAVGSGGAIDNGVYNVLLSEVQTAYASLTWSSPTVNTTHTVITTGGASNTTPPAGYAFATGTAHLFEFSAEAVSGVPEPSTLWLLAGGLAPLALRLRRRARRP
jgi:hypothetical protein